MRVLHRPIVAASLAVASLAAASSAVTASSPDEGVEVTPEALVAAAELSATTPSRYEMYVEMTGLPGMPSMGDSTTPLVTGEVSGTSSRSLIDMSVMMGGMLPFGDDELSMETITIDQDFYLRAPYFAALAEMSGGSGGPLADFAELGDGWAYVDGAALAADAGDLGSVFGTNASSPNAMLGALGTTTKTAPLGTETIHGVSSSGVKATINLGAMMEAQNVDPSMLPPEMAAIGDLDMPIEVWLGDNGYITRMTFELDFDQMLAAAAEAGMPADPDDADLAGVVMSTTMESFDFGDSDIVIDAPAEFVDMTEQFGELLAQAEQQQGA